MIKFSEVITGEMLYKRVIKKAFNTPLAGVVFMMYVFSLLSVIYDIIIFGEEGWKRDRIVLFIIVLTPILLISAFKNIKQKLYNKLPEKEKLTVNYEISTWYILIKDWEERTIKWTDIYKFEETKKTFDIYINRRQSITIDKQMLDDEDLIDLRELALMKLGSQKVKVLKQ